MKEAKIVREPTAPGTGDILDETRTPCRGNVAFRGNSPNRPSHPTRKKSSGYLSSGYPPFQLLVPAELARTQSFRLLAPLGLARTQILQLLLPNRG